MDFVFTKNLNIEKIQIKLQTDCANQTIGNFQFHKRNRVELFVNDDFFVNHSNHEESGDILLFDGHMAIQDRFHHYLRPELPDRLRNDILIVSDSGCQNVVGGIYCLGKINHAGQVILFSDVLSQYPIYYLSAGAKIIVSNNIRMIRTIMGSHGLSETKSLYPCVENIVFGSIIGEKTHITEIQRVPFAHGLHLTDRLQFFPYDDAATAGKALSYEQMLDEAERAIASYIKAIEEKITDADTIVSDITGGTDSRAILCFLLNSRLKHRISGRCIVSYPNPDANVAGYIMQRFGIPVARFPVVLGRKPIVGTEIGIRQNAGLFGGARDPQPFSPPIAFQNLIHFRGSFGELGGATPGSDYMDEASKTGDNFLDAAVNLFVRQRQRVGALDLVTEEAIHHVKQEMLTMFSSLMDQGYETEQLRAEAYLRTRCRTHFGLNSVLLNKTKMTPDVLANRWIVAARRKLPAHLHAKNKVIFDLILRNGKKDIAFMPMAQKKWSESIVPRRHRKDLNNMQQITFKSDPLSDLSSGLFIPLCFQVPELDDFSQLVDENDASVNAKSRFPAERNIVSFQKITSYLLDSLDQTSDIWHFFNRAAMGDYVKKSKQDFHTSGIAVTAMGRVACGLLWLLDKDVSFIVKEIISLDNNK
jgi:hypothetical protein